MDPLLWILPGHLPTEDVVARGEEEGRGVVEEVEVAEVADQVITKTAVRAVKVEGTVALRETRRGRIRTRLVVGIITARGATTRRWQGRVDQAKTQLRYHPSLMHEALQFTVCSVINMLIGYT